VKRWRFVKHLSQINYSGVIEGHSIARVTEGLIVDS
jgi:hypothetical protein